MSSAATSGGIVRDIKSTSGSTWFAILKQAGIDWIDDKAPKLAGSLAFFTMLSIAPLLIICIKVIGWFGQSENAQKQINGYISSNVGAEAAKSLTPMIQEATKPGTGLLATTISLIVLLFSASGVFGELQDSLNTIWEVKPRPDRGIMGTIKDRFFSFTMVLGVIFLLLVSLVVSTALTAVSSTVGGGESFLWSAVNFVISLVVITVLFALIFRFLPDAKVLWRDVWIGSILTAVLFTIGKALLGWYLGRGSTTSVYGAAGSLVAMLLWVYYSSQILFFGAEFIQAWAREHGSPMEPTENAVRITGDDRARLGISSQPKQPATARQDTASNDPPMPPMTFQPRSIRSPRPATAGVSFKEAAAAAGGVAVGAISAWYAARHGNGPDTNAKAMLARRIAAIESKVGRLNHLKEAVERVAIADRMKEVEQHLRHARTVIRAEESHRPRWAVRLGDKIAGNR